MWNLKTEKELFTLTGHTDSVSTVAVTANGKWVVSGSDDKTVKIWDLESREEVFTFTGHTEAVNALIITPCSRRIVSASFDKTLQVWDLETRNVIAKFTGESEIKCCAVAPDGVTIVAGEISGRLHFLRLEGVEA